MQNILFISTKNYPISNNYFYSKTASEHLVNTTSTMSLITASIVRESSSSTQTTFTNNPKPAKSLALSRRASRHPALKTHRPGHGSRKRGPGSHRWVLAARLIAQRARKCAPKRIPAPQPRRWAGRGGPGGWPRGRVRSSRSPLPAALALPRLPAIFPRPRTGFARGDVLSRLPSAAGARLMRCSRKLAGQGCADSRFR